MITEDYCDFETAKLLKEKGFDKDCNTYYDLTTETKTPKIVLSVSSKNWNYKWNPIPFPISAPTLQMAMKWLREVHNLCIEPYRTASGYLYTISKIWTGSEIYSDEFNGDDEDSGQWTTYEKACEAAIKYCLENLI